MIAALNRARAATQSLPPGRQVPVAWGSVVGSALQLPFRSPSAVLGSFQVAAPRHAERPHVRTVTQLLPCLHLSRGVVQISAYVDAWLASFLATGALAVSATRRPSTPCQ